MLRECCNKSIEINVEVSEVHYCEIYNILATRMALLALSPPPAFLETPGEPTIPFNSWIRMFDNYVIALSADDIPEKRKRALLIHCLGTEGQRIFYTLTVADDNYETALTALRAFFVQKVNVVAERNKFCQRAQRLSEPIVQYVAALRELLVNCEFGALTDDMIRDQIVEKTCTPRILERLLLETDLTLQKAITIAENMLPLRRYFTFCKLPQMSSQTV